MNRSESNFGVQLRVIALCVLALVLGVIAVLWTARDHRHPLERAGAKFARRDDGSVISIILGGPLFGDAHLTRLAEFEQLPALELTGGRYTEQGIEALRPLSHLDRLTIRQAACPSGSLSRLPPLPSLTSLIIEDCPWVIDHDVQSLARHTGLRELTLTGTQMTGAAIDSLLSLSQLESLTLTNNPALTIQDLQPLKQLTQLKTLDIRSMPMTSADLLALDAALPNATILASTDLLTDMQPLLGCGVDVYRRYMNSAYHSYVFLNCKVTDEALQLLWQHKPDVEELSFILTDLSNMHFSYLSRFQNLAKLTIDRNTGVLTAEGFGQLVDLPLQWLIVTDPVFDDAALAEVGKITTLIDLRVAGPMTDAGVSHLRGLQYLISIALRDSQVTGATLSDLKGIKTLRRLELSGSKLTREGVLAIAELPVEVVILRRSDIDEQAIHELGAMRPDIHIECD